MLPFTDKEQNCTGCSTCVCVCPAKCIKMEYDSEGFLFPRVDSARCVGCRRCEKACPVNSEEPAPRQQRSYAAYSKNTGARRESTSGGLFSLLAERIIMDGGAVYGAALDSGLAVEHIRAEDSAGIERLRMSKYAQSKTGDMFLRCKDDLDSGKTVLFTGTPCQIAGLKSFLPKEYGNLYTQDIVCHGVGSPKVWRENIRFREKTSRSRLKYVQFRNKENGWAASQMKYEYENGKAELVPHSRDLFYALFLKKLILRPCCYSCCFKGRHRCSDITLGDFWGIENVIPDINEPLGTSWVITNSPKGEGILGEVKDGAVIKHAETFRAAQANPMFAESAEKPENRGEFFDCMSKQSFQKAALRFGFPDERKKRRADFKNDRNNVKNEKGFAYSLLWSIKNINRFF